MSKRVCGAAVPVFLALVLGMVPCVGRADGLYRLEADGQTFDAYFEDYDGQSWLLIGRGREDWEFDNDGQGNPGDVGLNLKDPAGFAPKAFSDAIVNDLLDQAGKTFPSDVVLRVMRAAATDGSGDYQELRWRSFTGFPNANSAFTFDFDDAGGSAEIERVNAPAGLSGASTGTATGTTRDHQPAGNDADRVFTWAWGGHANKRGFSYGQSVQGLDNNNPSTFLWESGNEAHAIPYTEVYIPYEVPPQGPVGFADLGVTNITATSAIPYAIVSTNLDTTVLVWDVADQLANSTNDWADSVGLGPTNAGPVSGEATGLDPDTLYTFRFYGENGTNTGWSSARTFATALTPAQTPAFTSQDASFISVTLEWQDNADTETGYVLRRSDSGSGGPYTVVATLTANVTTYEDTTVLDGTTYHYQLAATNEVNGSATAFAACVTRVTTPTLPPLKGELGVWKPWANGGINPATSLPWDAGDTYRLVFVTSTTVRDATSTNILDYHSAITTFANNAGLDGDWFVIGMTDGTTGQDNTKTTGTGVGIFQTDGVTKVADSYIDFWDWSLDNPMSLDETGTFPGSFAPAVGGYADGQPEASGGRHLGGSTETPPRVHHGRSTDVGAYWARVYNGAAASLWRYYGMSDVLTVESTIPPGRGVVLQVR